MPPQAHAILSASSAERWLNCPPSALKNAEMEDTTSPYAEEGTAAHALCEWKVRKATEPEFNEPFPSISEYLDTTMEDCSEEYKNYILEMLNKSKSPNIFIEQRLDFSDWVPQGFGTGDCLIISEGELNIIDFKYGKGVEVSAVDNSQLKCYALGAYALFSDLYDIETVTLTIFQPRINHIDTWSCDLKHLLDWAEEVLKPTAELAIKGEGELKAGDHCRFCKAKTLCRKRAEYNLSLARYDFAMPDELTDAEIEDVLDKASNFKNWIGDIEEYALNQGLSGHKWERYKVVEGRSNRKFRDPDRVAELILAEGKEPYRPQELKTLTDIEKMLGKKHFSEVLGAFVEKPQGKPTLVPRTDKRDEYIPKNTAAEDFADEE